jgi:integrase
VFSPPLLVLHFLLQCCLVKRTATSSEPSSRRRHSYSKVLDNRKHPVRGLWRRNGSFYARVTVEDETGHKKLSWVPLAARSASEGQTELRKLLTERDENRLRHVGRSPTFAEYLSETYLPLLAGTGKKRDTIITEKTHYERWRVALGHLRLDKIKPSHVLDALNTLRAGRSPRTCNLALVCLRHVLKAAKRDGYLKALPTEDIAWQRVDKKSRRLFTLADIERICAAGLEASKNGRQLADYLRFLSLSGAREQEALRVGWADVDFNGRLVTIGADGDTKNREARHVDFSPALDSHLRDMHSRRDPDSQWLFPSPQRGEEDYAAKSFRESLKLARTAAKLEGFGFHDCRHHFISFAVMSGIDYMTIARWVGHKDGGVLIGKVYGHLSNEHARSQAARLSFGPAILTLPSSATA